MAVLMATRDESAATEAVRDNAVSRVYLCVHRRFNGLPRNAAPNVGGPPLGLAIGQEAHSFFNSGKSLVGSACRSDGSDG